MCNLCQYGQVHTISAEWNFFATVHGISPCDEVGGTLKSLVTKESLKRPHEKPILIVKDFCKFCGKSVKNIQVYLIADKEIEQQCKMKIKAYTIPSIRIPSSEFIIC